MKRYDTLGDPSYMVEDESGPYVLYAEAQARIEALEWLVEVQDLVIFNLEEGYDLFGPAFFSLRDIYKAARAAVGGTNAQA